MTGLTEEQLREELEFIKQHEQQGKDVFEYSIFGSPNQKIGDFTQQKLTSFGGVSNA